MAARDQATIEMGLTNTASNGTVTYPQAPKLTIGIRNVFGKLPQQVNGASSTNLPFCGGGQPFTLAVPTEAFAGTGEIINDYIWAIPPTYTVQGATRLTDAYWSNVSANTGYWYYLGGRSISVTPPVGGGNQRIYVQFYNRFCYETTAYGNLISGMLSAQQSFDFIREPTVTVSNVPASVPCGSQTGFTPSAISSQSGATFTYSVPSGSSWSVTTAKGVLYVVPSGSNGTTLTITPTCNCGGTSYSGTPKTVQITLGPQATPVFTVPVLELCPGYSQTVGVSQVPGATSYTFSGISAPLTMVQANTYNNFVTITAPSNLAGGVAQTLHVVANSGYGCAATSADLPVKAGYGSSALTVFPDPTMVGSRPTVCGKSWLDFRLEESQAIGTSTDMQWTANNCTIMTDTVRGTAREITVEAPLSGTFSVSLRFRDGCGEYHVPLYANSSYNTSLFAATSINGNPCSVPNQPRPTVYPNPAASSITLEHLYGSVRLYNAQGIVVWQAQVSANTATRIDTHSLPNGLYYVAGSDAAGQLVRQTLQIRQ
ncbi:T9SS type A sorting domain-containing protein [Hymenobacter rubidus]|uniref:T9SS type A sorting domain-containing protein n=1 Tax=Hymenobacter rubidus TaxID=1441626 RepID=UPI00192010A7|nr:T9SS type A sorting domain-containing protein [Hymenobacter rubidus]